MLLALLNWLKKSFASDHRSELERYLDDKGCTSTADLEYWMAEFENRRRHINRCLVNGDKIGAAHIRQYY